MTTPVPVPVSPLVRALHEALGGVAARPQVHELVRGALVQAGYDAVPEDLERFTHFVAGAVLAGVERTIGVDAAELVGQQLGQMLRMARPVAARATGTDDADELSGERFVETTALAGPRSSDVRATPRARPDIAAALRAPARGVPTADDIAPLEAPLVFPPRGRTNESGTQRKGAAAARAGTSDPSLRMPSRSTLEKVREPGTNALPAEVLVVTLDPQLVADIEAEARGRTRVVAISSSAELAQALSRGVQQIAVVLDTGIPAIDAPTFARHASALPLGTHVVLWGIGERQKARLVALYPHVAHWVASGESTSAIALLGDA